MAGTPHEVERKELLRSWKEIASYLGCEVRTCQRWERKLGLPVHRAEGHESRSQVFAYRDEIDRWFQETFRSSNGIAKGEKDRKRRWAPLAAGAAGLALLATAVFLVPWRVVRRQPADFSIKRSVLIVRDEEGRELWRFDTKIEDLLPESYFREHFQVMIPSEDNPFPSLAMKDIDGDGDVEVLFTPKSVRSPTGLPKLYAFDRKGGLRWPAFQAGRELKCGGRTFSPDYRIVGFDVHDLNGDEKLEILVIAYQDPDWPCQMVILDPEGRRLGEYWNAGYLRYPVYKDIDGDGCEELIVVGVNNEYRGGCLVVFDTRRISGGSPQSGRFACEGIGPGSELYYLTVPYTDVSRAMGNVVSGFAWVETTENDWIRAVYAPSLFYEFDLGMRCVNVYWGHGYEFFHNEAAAAGKVTSVLDEAYAKALLSGIRYWNGREWTPEPSRNGS